MGVHERRGFGGQRFGAREHALVEIFERMAVRHNALGVTAPVDEVVQLFHNRPFRVLGSSRFVDACLERVTDPWLRSLPPIGAIDQWVDSTDVLSESSMSPGARATYDSWPCSAR